MSSIKKFRLSSAVSNLKISNCRRFSSLFLTLKNCDIPDLISLLSIFIHYLQISARSATSFEWTPERGSSLTHRLRACLVFKFPSRIDNEIYSCKSCDGLDLSCIRDSVNNSLAISFFFGIQRHLPSLGIRHFRLKHFRLQKIGLTEHSSDGTFV